MAKSDKILLAVLMTFAAEKGGAAAISLDTNNLPEPTKPGLFLNFEANYDAQEDNVNASSERDGRTFTENGTWNDY